MKCTSCRKQKNIILRDLLQSSLVTEVSEGRWSSCTTNMIHKLNIYSSKRAGGKDRRGEHREVDIQKDPCRDSVLVEGQEEGGEG